MTVEASGIHQAFLAMCASGRPFAARLRRDDAVEISRSSGMISTPGAMSSTCLSAARRHQSRAVAQVAERLPTVPLTERRLRVSPAPPASDRTGTHSSAAMPEVV